MQIEKKKLHWDLIPKMTLFCSLLYTFWRLFLGEKGGSSIDDSFFDFAIFICDMNQQWGTIVKLCGIEPSIIHYHLMEWMFLTSFLFGTTPT